jgi:hypothetical protein
MVKQILWVRAVAALILPLHSEACGKVGLLLSTHFNWLVKPPERVIDSFLE